MYVCIYIYTYIPLCTYVHRGMYVHLYICMIDVYIPFFFFFFAFFRAAPLAYVSSQARGQIRAAATAMAMPDPSSEQHL